VFYKNGKIKKKSDWAEGGDPCSPEEKRGHQEKKRELLYHGGPSQLARIKRGRQKLRIYSGQTGKRNSEWTSRLKVVEGYYS